MLNQVFIDRLQERGITPATIATYGIEYAVWYNQPGYTYLTYSFDRKPARRWKNATDGKPKYAWGKNEQTKAHRLYYLHGLKDVIKTNKGGVYWTSGEVDTWTMHSYRVANYQAQQPLFPAVSTFGEGNQLIGLAHDLRDLGIRRVVMYPDLDEPGFLAARNIRRMLANTEIELVLKSLAALQISEHEHGTKFDLNKLWVHCDFNPDQFSLALQDCALVTDYEFEFYGLDPNPTEPAPKPVLNTKLKILQPPGEIDFKAENHQWIEGIIEALGPPDKRIGSVDKWYCPMPNHSDSDPSFWIDRTGNTPRPRCNCGIYNHDDAWSMVAQAKNLPTWEQYRAELIADHKPAPSAKVDLSTAPAMATEPPIPSSIQIVSSDEASEKFLAMLAPGYRPEVPPIINPITALHQFEGMGKIIDAGEVWGLIGGSGSGKTNFLESLVIEPLRQAGEHILIASGEWKPEKIIGRMVQRHGGISRTDQKLWRLWQAEAAQGVPEKDRKGRPLSQQALRETEQHVRAQQAWPGKTFYLPDAKLGIVGMVEGIRRFVQDAKVPIHTFVLDYFNMYAYNTSEHRMPIMQQLQYLKNMLEPSSDFPGLRLIIAFQVTKHSAKLMRELNKSLDSADAQAVREDPLNFQVSLKPEYWRDGDGNITGIRDCGQIRVIKNSEGGIGDVHVAIDLPRLRWIDRIVPAPSAEVVF